MKKMCRMLVFLIVSSLTTTSTTTTTTTTITTLNNNNSLNCDKDLITTRVILEKVLASEEYASK